MHESGHRAFDQCTFEDTFREWRQTQKRLADQITEYQEAAPLPSYPNTGQQQIVAGPAHAQAPTLRDDDDSDGWYWGDVREALIATWPDCNMNNGATDCTLGPQQTQYAGLSCSGTLSAKVTFYSYPDNDSGAARVAALMSSPGSWIGTPTAATEMRRRDRCRSELFEVLLRAP